MDSSFLISLAAGTVIVAIPIALSVLQGKISEHIALGVAFGFPLLVLGLFYTLAVHVYRHLGGWPSTIGMDGFPRGLVLHADLAMFTFGTLLLSCILAWPVAFVLCLFIPSLSIGQRYLGFYALSSALAFGLMCLAPASFLDWWWD